MASASQSRLVRARRGQVRVQTFDDDEEDESGESDENGEGGETEDGSDQVVDSEVDSEDASTTDDESQS